MSAIGNENEKESGKLEKLRKNRQFGRSSETAELSGALPLTTSLLKSPEVAGPRSLIQRSN